MYWGDVEIFLGISVPPERRAFLEQWFPHVRFQIPSELSGLEYYRYLYDLLVNFFTQADRQNEQKMKYWHGLHHESGAEGGMGIIYIGGEFIDHCKLYWHEETTGGNFGQWKGLLFRDHDESPWDIYKIYKIADALEKFLREKKIAFQRYGVRRADRSKVLQS